MLLSNGLKQTRVVIIGARFGTASQAIDAAIREQVGDDNVQSLWYEESRFERKIGRSVGRLIRLAVQALPLPQNVRSLSERLIGAIRFRRRESIAEQLKWAQSIRPADHLLLVKPMFLRPNDLDALRKSVGATRVSVVLWDALWRTPSVGKLIHIARVFSTEPTDCKWNGFTLLPVPPLVLHQNSERDARSNSLTVGESLPPLGPSNVEQPIRLFFCGSWSLDRWLSARRLMAAVRSLENGLSKGEVGPSARRKFIVTVHLVTENKLAAWLTAWVRGISTPLSAVEYEEGVAQCDVVLDLGRAGQSSPSERLSTAAKNGKILASTNFQLEYLGFPVVPIKPKGWIEALKSCDAAFRTNVPIQSLWEANSVSRAFVITPGEWANSVLRSSENQEVSPSGNDGRETSEPPFSFVSSLPKISERIPA